MEQDSFPKVFLAFFVFVIFVTIGIFIAIFYLKKRKSYEYLNNNWRVIEWDTTIG
jgi:hypothetical protein